MSPFSLPFMRTALAVSLLAGTSVSVIGAFVLVRRQVFVGLVASQLAALGAVLGVLLGLHAGAHGVALAVVAGGMFLVARLSRSQRVPEESWLAMLYILGAGSAVMLLSKSPQGEAHTMGVFFGNVLALGTHDVWESIVLFALTTALVGPWSHKWIWISYDPLSARVAGLKVVLWNLLFWGLFAASMTLAIHLFGVLLAFAYLVLPAAAGLLICRKMGMLFVAVPVVSAGATVVGFYLSFLWDMPTGPFVASLLALICFAARLWEGRQREATS